MRSHLCNTAKSIKEQLRVDLQKRLITILFDIGSRAGRSFLGVGAQYMDKFVVKIVHLGIVVMHEKKTAVNLYQRIKAILDDFGISMDQIYNITTDNGANVIRASDDMLKAVALQVAESLEETDYENCQNAEQDDMDHGSSSPPQGDQNDFGTRGEAAQYDDETDEDDEESDDDIENVLITMMESGPYEGSAALTPTRCAAHTIQLAVHDALAYWSTEVVEIRAGYVSMRNKIFMSQIDASLPPTSNATRWSSSYWMVKGMMNVRSPDFEELMTHELWTFTESLDSPHYKS